MLRRIWPVVLGGWLLTTVMLCLSLAPNIMRMTFPDPDDAMRLLEVRDWLSGQSWWDVGQHRLNGGHFSMHWSRLVDLPLAAVMLVFDPLFSPAVANRLAMTIIPLLTLLALMTTVAAITRRLGGTERAQLAVLLAPLSIPIIYQIRPMRIDHHGWQIVLALVAVWALVSRPNARSGAICGLALAMLLTVSLEGLPITTVVVAVAAFAWALDPRRRTFLLALGGTMFAVASLFQIATRGPGMLAPACDAMSPAWLAVLGVGAVALMIATVFSHKTFAVRLVILAAGGSMSLATLLSMAPQCLNGPFATLDPLVYNLWYLKVSEGLPIWDQMPVPAIITIAFPVVGLIGTIFAFRQATGPERENWAMLLAVLLGASIVSLLVQRAGGTANAIALPGGAWVLMAMLARARRIEHVLLRILATLSALILVSPGIIAGAVFAMSQPSTLSRVPAKQLAGRIACTEFSDVRAIAILPPSVIFAPLDITPDLIATTNHHGIGSGYHRNASAMHRVIATFTGSPQAAEATIRASGARYVVGCPALDETEIYKHVAPNGFWARLERGERFAWLVPLPIAGSPVLAWKVIDSSRAPLSEAPVRP